MKVVVVGAGVAGLVAGHLLAREGAEVVVLEASERIGGKLRRASVADVTVDVGAEAMLARRAEGTDLARDLGLPLVHPTTATSRLWVDGALRPLPPSLMGAPMDLDALEASGVLSPEGMARARAEAGLAVPDPRDTVGRGDRSVGSIIDERFGREVTDRLVEPLLGGVYAGHAREISVKAAVPQLAALYGNGPLTPQLAAIPRGGGAPVFAGIEGGMGLLPEMLAAGLDVRTGQAVVATGLGRGGLRRLVVHTPDGTEDADAVVLALPAHAAARIITGFTGGPSAASELALVDHASVAVVTHAFRIEDWSLGHDLSGFLVPPDQHRRIKASTFSFAKWDWVRRAGEARGVLHLRTSIGRARESHTLDFTDNELIAQSLADLAEATGLRATPVDTHVQRWALGLPQYAVSHTAVVDGLRREVTEVPGLAIAGAAYDGVGIPAVIASARRAVDDLLAGAGGRVE